jgi:competence protein ComEC
MFLSVLSFFLGVFLSQQWSMLPSSLLITLAFILAIFAAYLKYWRVAFFLTGIVYASVTANLYLSTQLSPELQGKEFLIQGDIIGLPEYNTRRVRFDFQLKKAALPLPDKLRLIKARLAGLISCCANKSTSFWRITEILVQAGFVANNCAVSACRT